MQSLKSHKLSLSEFSVHSCYLKIFIPHPPLLFDSLPLLEASSFLLSIFHHTFRVLSPMEKKPLVGFASAITLLESENFLLSSSLRQVLRICSASSNSLMSIKACLSASTTSFFFAFISSSRTFCAILEFSFSTLVKL